jgi:hypothetical protein
MHSCSTAVCFQARQHAPNDPKQAPTGPANAAWRNFTSMQDIPMSSKCAAHTYAAHTTDDPLQQAATSACRPNVVLPANPATPTHTQRSSLLRARDPLKAVCTVG